MHIIQTNNLTKYYGKSRGIIGLNLNVNEGDFFGFIGPNGAGKSTTIRILLGLIRPNSGEAKLFELDSQKEKKRILNQVGYLPSEVFFYSGMRVRDVLKLSANLRQKDCSREAETLCERLQLDLSKKVDQLSFGNRKKVGIVCALQHNPKLCILDEPTSGLDPLMQREFFSILRERNQKGATIFLSSHILSEIQRNCKRAAIIRKGQMIASGSVEELSKTNTKRVIIHGDMISENFPGIRDRKETADGGISFLYSGDINALLHTISRLSIQDLSISEPDLEEVFFHYYTEGSTKNDNH